MYIIMIIIFSVLICTGAVLGKPITEEEVNEMLDRGELPETVRGQEKLLKKLNKTY